MRVVELGLAHLLEGTLGARDRDLLLAHGGAERRQLLLRLAQTLVLGLELLLEDLEAHLGGLRLLVPHLLLQRALPDLMRRLAQLALLGAVVRLRLLQ